MDFGGRVTKRVISHLAEGIGTGTKQFWTPEIMLFQMIYENKCCTAGSGASFFKHIFGFCILHYKLSVFLPFMVNASKVFTHILNV